MAITKLQNLSLKQRKIIRAWCMYDWANSAFATSGVAALVPVYFVYLFNEAVGNETSILGMTFTGSSMWSFAIAFSTAIVAISSPLLGILADRVMIKKTLLWIYTAAGSIFMILTFFSAYTGNPWMWLGGTFLLGNIGFAGSLVFYNSLLPHISPKNLLDDISSRGFAYGYVGGGLLLLIHLILNLLAPSDHSDLITRASIASIGFWWFGWAIWTFKVVPEPHIPNAIQGLTPTKATKLAFRELAKTFKEIRKFKVLLLYLGAYLLFNDGIQTVMGIAGAFAADTLKIPLVFNMATILIIQFVAAFGAMGFSWLASHINTKEALIVSLVGWSIVVLFGVGIVPLVPSEHSKFDYQLVYDKNSQNYLINQAPELGKSPTDQAWSKEINHLDVNQSIRSSEAKDLLKSVESSENSQFTISISGGTLNGNTEVGILHPSNIGSGPVDWWPSTIRSFLWNPLGIDAGFQWLILGVSVGIVMGGSQALARSLFAQISPETRSGEFFSFFGFMNRASSVFGPMMYVIVTSIFDTRVAVTSILVIIIVGTVMLKSVNVSDGIKVAKAEDKRIQEKISGNIT